MGVPVIKATQTLNQPFGTGLYPGKPQKSFFLKHSYDERGVTWSVEYRDLLILAVDPLLNTMTTKRGVIFNINAWQTIL